MADAIVGAIESAAKSWREEAAERRRISKTDPVADTLDYCAGELAARVRDIASATQYETAEQRAKREKVTPQTVRDWIRKGWLPARPGPKGYQIPLDAELVRRAG